MFLEIKEKVLWAAFVVSVVALVVEHQFADQASEGCDVLEAGFLLVHYLSSVFFCKIN